MFYLTILCYQIKLYWSLNPTKEHQTLSNPSSIQQLSVGSKLRSSRNRIYRSRWFQIATRLNRCVFSATHTLTDLINARPSLTHFAIPRSRHWRALGETITWINFRKKKLPWPNREISSREFWYKTMKSISGGKSGLKRSTLNQITAIRH